MSLTYFLNDLEMIPVAPIITGITLLFTFHMRSFSIVRSLYYYYYYYYYYLAAESVINVLFLVCVLGFVCVCVFGCVCVVPVVYLKIALLN